MYVVEIKCLIINCFPPVLTYHSIPALQYHSITVLQYHSTRCVFQVSRGSSIMAAASYDQLLRQVEVLKMENSNLRQELQDNSNHLTKLETEASNMKVSADRGCCSAQSQLGGGGVCSP